MGSVKSPEEREGKNKNRGTKENKIVNRAGGSRSADNLCNRVAVRRGAAVRAGRFLNDIDYVSGVAAAAAAAPLNVFPPLNLPRGQLGCVLALPVPNVAKRSGAAVYRRADPAPPVLPLGLPSPSVG